MIDWTFALLFRPDVVKISLESEAVERRRVSLEAGTVAEPLEQCPPDDAGTGCRQVTTRGSHAGVMAVRDPFRSSPVAGNSPGEGLIDGDTQRTRCAAMTYSSATPM